jgi:hypothetical protein
VRLQISHIYEAMKIVKEIRDSPALMKAVDRSDRFTKRGFAALLAFAGSPEFEKVMDRGRFIWPSAADGVVSISISQLSLAVNFAVMHNAAFLCIDRRVSLTDERG